ncbi:MAG: hypothetical protein RR413_04490, partial [Christensenellaceae bacterium]
MRGVNHAEIRGENFTGSRSFYEQIVWIPQKDTKTVLACFLETVPYHCQKSLCRRFSPIK